VNTLVIDASIAIKGHAEPHLARRLGGIGGYRLTGVTLCQDIGRAKPAHNPRDRQYQD